MNYSLKQRHSIAYRAVPTEIGYKRFWSFLLSGLVVSSFLFYLPGFISKASAQDLEEVTFFQVAEDREGVLEMEGTINSDTPTQLKAILDANPEIRTIEMYYCPGSSDDEANFPMARMVRARGLNTHITSQSQIASGCVDFFLAGNARTMERGAKIGVHSWYDDDSHKKATDYPPDSPEHELNRKYIEDMLGSDAFYWFTIKAAPANGMHYMTEEEIADYELLTP